MICYHKENTYINFVLSFMVRWRGGGGDQFHSYFSEKSHFKKGPNFFPKVSGIIFQLKQASPSIIIIENMKIWDRSTSIQLLLKHYFFLFFLFP